MISEQELQLRVKEYFYSLGWPLNSIYFDYRINPQQRADLVLKELGSLYPQVVVEIKSKLNVSELRDHARLRFNPSVRQLQKYTSAVGAEYYVLTDGEVYLWLQTDSTGRPRVLDNPIRPFHERLPRRNNRPTRDEIVRVFRSLLDHFEAQSDWIIQDSKIALILLAHFSDVFLRDSGLKQALNTDLALEAQRIAYAERFGIPPNELTDERSINTAFDILQQVPFRNANASDILLAIDDVFLQRIRSLYSVSRWLADALVTFAELESTSSVLDVAANVGNILAAVHLTEPEAYVTGFARNPRNANWAQVQQAVLENFQADIRASDILLASSKIDFKSGVPSHVITAPVMGERVKRLTSTSQLYVEGVTQLEDLLLESALNTVQPGGRVVFLVPEGLLFGSGKRSKVRKLLLSKSTLVAIISLENGALKPFSGIRTSILILQNQLPSPDHEVFMSIVSDIDEIPYPNSILNSTEIPELSDTLRDYKRWRSEKSFTTSSKSWAVPQSKLEIDNLSASRYQPLSSDFEPFKDSKLVRVSEVCLLIKRGSSIRLTGGSVPLIGPATIRPMRLDEESLGRTSSDQITSRALQVSLNDVVINNIGTHLGAAAVVTNEFAESYVSQHIIIFRPDAKVIDPTYLAIALNSASVQEQIKVQATGSVMPSLTIKRAHDLLIPLPDLDTQQEIVMSISSARDAVIVAEKNLDAAKHLFESLLLHLGHEGNSK